MIPDFIESYQIQESDCCDNVIDWFESNKSRQERGISGSDSGKSVNTDIKDTTDISLSVVDIQLNEDMSDIFYPLFGALQYSLNEYILKYSILQRAELHISPRFNIQRYTKGQHFKYPHYESSSFYKRKRILTWMIYLNDVNKEGKTVFSYYSIETKPTKGRILLWPADFTHTHFGDIVEDTKYIMTGWFDIKHPKFSEKQYKDIDIRYFNIL